MNIELTLTVNILFAFSIKIIRLFQNLLKVFRNVKHTISISLVIILLLPMTIKLFDGFFHHHDHFYCSAKNEKHFHQHHEKCPIPIFELSFFSDVKQIQTNQKFCFYNVQNDICHFVPCYNNLKFSFFLRSPPVFISRMMTS